MIKKLLPLNAQIVLLNLFFGSLLTFFVWSAWCYIVAPMIASGTSNLQRELSQRQKEVNDLRSASAKTSDVLFFDQQFSTAAMFNKKLHAILTKYKDVTLISFKEGQPKSEKVTSAIGTGLSVWRGRTVKRVEFDIKILGKYKPVINLLKDLEKTGQGIFWDSVTYRVNPYPNTVLHLKLHVLSK